MNLIKRISRQLRRELMPPRPFDSHQHLPTYIFSVYDDPYQPTSRLIDTVSSCVREVEHIDLSDLATRSAIKPQIFTQWPGEHYKLLAAMMRYLQPRSVIEIGTHTGWSSLAMKKYLPAEGRITTFDIVSWDALHDTCLTPEDFADGRLVQHVEDLADRAVVAKHQDLLAAADLIFMDGPHDGPTEYKMMANLQSISFTNNPLFVFDDIRMYELLKFWRDLALPKMDITSFGHWSGTGLAEWKSSNE